MAVTSTTNYLAGGKETFDVAVKADAAGTQIEFTGDGTADWKWDDKLVETITAINIKTARLGGQEVPAADMQAMVEGMMVGQVSTSSVRIDSDGKEMILVDTNDITTELQALGDGAQEIAMKLNVFGFAAICLVACATSPPTTEQLLLGAWKCEAPMGSGALKGDVAYEAGGKSTMKVTHREHGGRNGRGHRQWRRHLGSA